MESFDNNTENEIKYIGGSDDSGKKEQVRLYESLAPSSAITNGQEYFAALDWALEEKDIYNIAISGPYGSGKSSVINSYLNRKTSKKYKKRSLKISLATFDLENTCNDIQARNSDAHSMTLEQKLEYGILKHLFYSVDTSRIPQSRYRKLHGKKKWISNALYSFLAMLTLLFILYFIKPDKVRTFYNATNGHNKWLIYPIIIFVIFASVYTFINWFRRNIRVREVNLFNKIAIGANEKNEDSIFNKNMDEIMYFFERTKTKIIFIEDIDRFESTNIFVALRELNNLINHNENIKKKVTFVYAIKDDMFMEDGERTKFFDFIIPVVPYISSTNSGEILREKLRFEKDGNKSLVYDISESFVSLISPYIRDARQLTSICNEFNIYKNTLKGRQRLNLKDQNMFALMIFKNLYPMDFAQLESERTESIVRTAFIDKGRFIEGRASLINERKEEGKTKLDNIEKEILKNVKEIKLSMLNCLTESNSSWVNSINDGSETHDIDKILRDDFELNQLRKKPIIVYCSSRNRNNFPKTVNDIDSFFAEKNENYFDRIEVCENGLEKSRDEFRKSIEEYEIEINNLKSYSIQKIIEDYGTDFLSEEVKNNNLLVFLLRKGFIDETYENYINYFHPNSITQDEMNFVLGIRNQKSSYDYTFPLLHTERIFNMLQDYEFKQSEVLNYNLVDYVLESKINSSHAKYLFERLSDRSEKSMSFVKAYFNRGMFIDLFINKLCKSNMYFWLDICKDSGIPKEREFEYLDNIVRFADVSDIQKLDVCDVEDKDNGGLSIYIETHRDIFSAFKNSSIEKQLQLLKALEIKFYDVDLSNVDEIICDDIYSNNRYVLNKQMISKIIFWKSPELGSALNRKNYTVIRNAGYKPLLDYVHDNFEEYLDNLILGEETNVDEDVEALVDIFERCLVSNPDICIDVVKKQKTIWMNITDCRVNNGSDFIAEIWDYLLSSDKVAPLWQNVIDYYEIRGVTTIFGKYIDRNAEKLKEDAVNDISDDLIYEVLSNSDVSVEHFNMFIKLFGIEVYSGELSVLSEEKIASLVDKNLIEFEINSFNEIGKYALSQRILFILRNKDEFFAYITNFKIQSSEIIKLLDVKELSESEKKSLLGLLDLSKLDDSMALKIRDLNFVVDKEIVEAAWKALPEEKRYKLLLNQIDVFTDDELSELFAQLDEVYHQFADRKSHKYTISYSDYNMRLTSKLKDRGYVTRADEEWVDKKGLLKAEKEHVITGFVKQAKISS